MKQRTLRKDYSFEGRGLHTGCFSHMTICPAPPSTGIRLIRTDISPDVYLEALASNVVSTARSTVLAKDGVSVGTAEHVLSALYGLGVDNALIKIDGPEVPILDGSALPYVSAITADGFEEQPAEREWVEIDRKFELDDPRTGAHICIEPAEEPSFEVTIDFNSRVLGVQTVKWDATVDFSSQVAPCRTFCFFHEILKLAMVGLVKGGSVDNAIVIVEKPVHKWQLRFMARKFRQPLLDVTSEGYLSNLVLRFPDECGRHKLMDLIGDISLCGGFLKAKVTAFKPGHKLNTKISKLIQK